MTRFAERRENRNYEVEIRRVAADDSITIENDSLAIEEPLEIRLGLFQNDKRIHKAISITMRTPGNDFELAAGFLFTEGILQSKNQIESIKHCGKFPNNQNTIRLDLTADTTINLNKIERNFYTTSSCGVCGKSSLEALATGAKRIESIGFPTISADTVRLLPQKLNENQIIFRKTGGLHAAALFTANGDFINSMEDVGRHNAVDKLIGAGFLENKLPLAECILFLSGRASFELLQKAVMAQIPIVCAVGAPSSLAVEAAKKFNVTLLGFVRDDRFNIYNDNSRVIENRK